MGGHDGRGFQINTQIVTAFDLSPKTSRLSKTGGNR
jgi:hypothetical protein